MTNIYWSDKNVKQIKEFSYHNKIMSNKWELRIGKLSEKYTDLNLFQARINISEPPPTPSTFNPRRETRFAMRSDTSQVGGTLNLTVTYKYFKRAHNILELEIEHSEEQDDGMLQCLLKYKTKISSCESFINKQKNLFIEQKE